MPSRMLRDSIISDETINRLSPLEETLYLRLCLACDTKGRIDAQPAVIKGRCFPLKDYRVAQIRDALRALRSAELISLDRTASGDYFVQIINWDGKIGKSTSAPKQNKALSENAALRERFDRWYAVYPKKKNKEDAVKAFFQLRPDQALVDRMIEAVNAAVRNDPQWKENGGRFIPNPATWLHKHGWEDELPQPEAATPSLASRGLEDWDEWTR